MRILVSGAAGFIGSHLAQHLSRSGEQVIGLDAYTPFYAESWKRRNAARLEAEGVEMLECDLAKDELSVLPGDVEVVYHFAGQPGLCQDVPFEVYLRDNIVATQRLLDVLLASKSLRCFVFASSSSVYGSLAIGTEDEAPRPVSVYGVTKLAAEQLSLARHRASGFPACSLRLFSVYGPRERPDKLFPRLIGSILSGSEFSWHGPSSGQSRSFTFVSDAVDGLASVRRNIEGCVGEVINLGGAEEVEVAQAVHTVQRILGCHARIVDAPPRAGDPVRTHADTQKARRLLNYSPRVSLEEGLRAEIEWFTQEIFERGGWPPRTAPARASLTGAASRDTRESELSVVVPVHDEAENIAGVVREICKALDDRAVRFEIICVDDGSTDDSPSCLERLQAECSRVRQVRHRERCGQSAAILSGVRAARSPWIVTLDGDGQNDPADIPKLLDARDRDGSEGRLQLVAGIRQRRHDGWLRRLSSRVANGVRSFLLRDGVRDTGCGLKLFRRDAFLALPSFDHMHRFLPALFRRGGGQIRTVGVGHRPRTRGRSKYGMHNRLWVGIVDLFGLLWLQRRVRLPVIEEPTRDRRP